MSDALTRPVSINKSSRPFGELTLADVQARAQELSDAVGWGPTAKVAPVARAWKELAEAEAMAQALWVIPPGGSLL